MNGLTRTWILLRAHLAAGPREGQPVAALLTQVLIASTFCGLVRDGLPPFAYGLFALTLTGSMVALPMLGELGWLLRRDEAEAWALGLPARPMERKLARILQLLVLLGGLTLASTLPAAVLAPGETGLVGRLALPVLGLGLASFLAAVLLLVQSVLGGRAEGLLVLFQTVLVVGTVVGLVLGLRGVPTLARIPTLGDPHAPFLWLVPPAWFAAPLATVEGESARWWLPFLVTALSLVVLFATPTPARIVGGHGASWISVLLQPFRSLATLLWVRRDERAVFDLVYDALPREREVVLRTVPILGIPLAFLIVASTGVDPGRGGRGDLLALLLFTIGITLPILLVHVPATASPQASWLTQTAPLAPGALVSGTLKALCVRFLLPLFVLLGFLSWEVGGPALAVRLGVPAFLVSLLVLRRLYPICVSDPPLSVAPDEIRFDLDWTGVLVGLAMVLAVLAVLANRLLDVPTSLLAVLVLVGMEVFADRRLRRRLG